MHSSTHSSAAAHDNTSKVWAAGEFSTASRMHPQGSRPAGGSPQAPASPPACLWVHGDEGQHDAQHQREGDEGDVEGAVGAAGGKPVVQQARNGDAACGVETARGWVQVETRCGATQATHCLRCT